MRFMFPHSHAFRRGRVIVEDYPKTAPECLVEFGDGVTVMGEWQPSGDEIELTVPVYRTAKGTVIPSKTWKLARGHDGEWRSDLVT